MNRHMLLCTMVSFLKYSGEAAVPARAADCVFNWKFVSLPSAKIVAPPSPKVAGGGAAQTISACTYFKGRDTSRTLFLNHLNRRIFPESINGAPRKPQIPTSSCASNQSREDHSTLKHQASAHVRNIVSWSLGTLPLCDVQRRLRKRYIYEDEDGAWASLCFNPTPSLTTFQARWS